MTLAVFTPLGWTSATIDDVTRDDVSQRDPSSGAFEYVDIASIDNIAKRIIAAKRVAAAKAPSRARQVLHASDVLVSMTRPNLNAVALIPRELEGAIGSTGLHVLRPEAGLEPRWLHYVVQSSRFIASMCDVVQGALYPAVRPRDIRGWTMQLPPAPEQRRIADALDEILSELDAGVASLERLRDKLRLYRASVLKAAVDASLTARWRTDNQESEPASALLGRILSERRRRWEDDQLARFAARGIKPPKNWKAKYREPRVPASGVLPILPDSWCWAAIEQVGEVRLGRQRAPRHHHGPHMRPYLRVANVYEDRLDLRDVKGNEFYSGGIRDILAEIGRHSPQ